MQNQGCRELQRPFLFQKKHLYEQTETKQNNEQELIKKWNEKTVN